MPILVFEKILGPRRLNPSLLQFLCSEACGPIRDFHLLRPSDKDRYLPSAISANNELAFWSMTTNLVVLPFLIPRQIFEKRVSQYEGNLVSCLSKPVFPPARLETFLSLHKGDV